ncbi:DNA (cytosine-5)-methyltransferase 1 [Vibrio crassostreae]|nr:DNA (cytosine-5)-methyltransferase 1 [Vibrio crassostreae]CAK3598165.1 DNA (cytosine-5)-methyltransferase 1 [Vibrio crassostreae]CAK3622852.1 DNA (cytosine-5)-methyltransferase 1 [Vibrio crassostreae]CAK3632750.1 DNA (cytosine-5)-methyltransferase 1 [Vibrio crassostreae]CAK3682340.1 DNA (cytosine-5)-methyltransferase 1 [Vibrio crassostreae]
MKGFVEFFAGVGLVREGLSSYGWTCLLANDISKDKQETYIENYGDSDFQLGDVWDLAQDPKAIPNVFLYTASFPCTDLTVAGSQAGLAGQASGTLNAVIDIIGSKRVQGNQPAVVLLENVRGFLSSHNGSDLLNTVKQFNGLGYFVDILELDAIDFSAQSRPRVFLIAVKESLAKRYPTSADQEVWNKCLLDSSKIRPRRIKNIFQKNRDLNWVEFNIPSPSSSNLRLSNIIDESINEESCYWWSESRKQRLYAQMNERHRELLVSMCSSREKSYATVFRRMRNGKSMAELRVDGFAGCLRTPRGGSSKQILIEANNGNWNVRLLSPREYSRLQGVRDSFILPENSNKAYFAMGDAVCVPVIEYLAENILDPIYSLNKE